MISKDTLWKGIIEDLVEEFILYFFPELIDHIDFKKGITFLDKELEQLFPQSEAKLRHVDKLFSCYFNSGQERWFLIHVEVQGYADPGFAKRMFEYAYRIKDKYGRQLTALAIYTDSNRQFHFKEYRESFAGTELYYRFNTFILLNFQPEELRQKNNIFGLVMETARVELNTDELDDEKLLALKKELIRNLFKHGVAKQKIKKLLNFIRYYTSFEQDDFLRKFEKAILEITKSREVMGIEEAILHEVKTKGFEEGKKEGIEEYARLMVIKSWNRGMNEKEIAEFVEVPLGKVQTIIAELHRPAVSEEEE